MRIAALTLALLIVIGCTEKSSKPLTNEEPTGYPAAKTITQLLMNFRQSHIDMDYDEYEKLLDGAYVFVFDPDDVGEQTHFKDQWPCGDDLSSARNMFSMQPNANGQVVDEIELEFIPGDPSTSPADSVWQRVILTNVELTVRTTDPNGDVWYLVTPGNYEVYLDLVQADDGDGSTVWKIVRFEDRPPNRILAGPGTEQTTWGIIKALFH